MDTSAPAFESSAAGLDARTVMSSPGETVRHGTTMWEVVERFLTGATRHVVVVDDNGRCLGVVCTRHLASLWPLGPERLKEIAVESAGLAGWVSLRPGDDLRTCARTLTEYQLDAVPVLDDDAHVVGVVTTRDVTRAVSDAREVRRQSRNR